MFWLLRIQYNEYQQSYITNWFILRDINIEMIQYDTFQFNL